MGNGGGSMSRKLAGIMDASPPHGPMGGVKAPPAPGVRGKGSKSMGMAPRQTYAPMNTAVAMTPPAGAMEQKALAPPHPRMTAAMPPAPMMKMSSLGNEVSMATMGVRPLRLQDMLKTAMAESSRRVNVGLEADRQMNELVEEKTAAPEGAVDTEYALKLASAIEYIAADFEKEATEQPGPGTGPGALHVMQAESSGEMSHDAGHGHNTVPMHTGLQAASQSGGSKTQVPNDADRAPGGSGHQTTAMSGGKGKVASIRASFNKVAEDEKLEKQESEGMEEAKKGLAKAEEAHRKEAGVGQFLKNRYEDVKGIRGNVSKALAAHKNIKTHGGDVPEKILQDMKRSRGEHLKAVGRGAATAGTAAGAVGGGGYAAKKHMDKKASGLALAARAAQVKVAEDAINPAHISAGSAVPPETSESGESGGAPVAGMPQGPRGLVHSNESAINYKRNQAYGGRKSELKEYFNEPALTMSTDKTLSAAFDHTGQAGTKFASAGGGSTKVAAARAILSKLAEEAEQSVKDKGEKKEKKEKDSHVDCH